MIWDMSIEMNDNFEKLKVHADARWEALVNGNKPWIRIGSALCGEAACLEQYMVR